jgi:hypothetical protein
MPGLGIVTARRSAAIYRLPRKFINNDDVFVTIGLTSSYEVHQFDRLLNIKPGEGIVLTASEPGFVKVPTYGEYINVRAPRRTLSSPAGRRIWPTKDNPALRLLTRYIGIVDESESLAAPDLRRQAVTHIHDHMGLPSERLGMRPRSPRPGVQAVRLRAIKEEIATRMHQADPSGATIAAGHQLKPPWIQRVFESEWHDLHRVCAHAAPRPRAPMADKSPLC